MARTFNGTTHFVTLNGAGWRLLGGAHTIAVLIWPNGLHDGTIYYNSSGNDGFFAETVTGGLGLTANDVSDTSASALMAAGSEWYLVAVTKAAGSAVPTYYSYRYSTGVFTPVAGTVAIPDHDVNTGNTSYIGGNGSGSYNGDVAMGGAWARVLSAQEIQNLAYGLDAWFAPAPAFVHVLDNSAQVCRDWTQTAPQTAVSGTTVSTRSIPLFAWDAPILTVRPTTGAPTSARDARHSARVALQGAATATDIIRDARHSVRVGIGPAVGVSAQVWNGSAFVSAPVKVWNGTAFVDPVAVKTWNGSAFV